MDTAVLLLEVFTNDVGVIVFGLVCVCSGLSYYCFSIQEITDFGA